MKDVQDEKGKRNRKKLKKGKEQTTKWQKWNEKHKGTQQREKTKERRWLIRIMEKKT